MKQLNIQDYFLNTARKEKMNVVVFLTNGFQLKGVIKGFDNSLYDGVIGLGHIYSDNNFSLIKMLYN